MADFKISPHWECIKSFDELIADSRFIFSTGSYKGARPRIVLKTPINGIDCIEIDYDQYGLITNGESVFQGPWGLMIQDSSKRCVQFIREFLIEDGASYLITKTAPDGE